MSEEESDIKKVAKKLNPKGLVSGELLKSGNVLKNLPFLTYVAFLMIVYISYGYYTDSTIRHKSAEEKRSEELYSELQSLMEVYNQKSLQSSVASKLEKKKIYEAKDPPRVIWVEKSN